MRNTPVIVFVNKLDREGRPALELLDELEQKLNIHVRPLTWPINMGQHFKGVYNLHEQNVYLFRAGKTVVEEERFLIRELNDPELDRRIGSDADRLREEVALVEGVYEPFSTEAYRNGALAPVFFGSALNNFGVRELLETFLHIAPAPVGRPAVSRDVDPDEDAFSGFVFKIHANLDPRHRDRIAFLRVCSGTFQRAKAVHHVRLGKQVRFTNPYSFMAERKQTVDVAYPGDVVGLYDRGDLKIGDTLTEGEGLEFQGIPNFSPAIFREVVNADPMRSKQFNKGLKQLTEEGVAQLFTQRHGNRLIIGTVGELQFDVIAYRLEHEYGAVSRYQALPYRHARWITAEDKVALDRFMQFREHDIVWDRDGQPVYLAESPWVLRANIEKYPEVEFHETSEFKRARKEKGAA
jgi:peptide chain release factor 3